MENIHDEKLIDVHFNEIFPEEKYKLVSNFLKEYITHYKMSVEDLKKRGVYARARKSKTITQLLYLVDKMIEDNTYPIIDNFREMLLKYKIYEQDHLEYMTLLLYPEDCFNNNKEYFYYYFGIFFNYHVNQNERVDPNKYPYDIVNYCNKYRDYCERTKIRRTPEDPTHLVFIHYSDEIMAYCYLYKVPIEMVDQILDNLRDSYLEVKEYLEFNYNYDKFHLLAHNIIETVFLRAIGKNPIIK